MMIEGAIEQHSLALADPQTPKRVLGPVSTEILALLSENSKEQGSRQLVSEGEGEINVGRLVEDAMAEYDADDPLLASYQKA